MVRLVAAVDLGRAGADETATVLAERRADGTVVLHGVDPFGLGDPETVVLEATDAYGLLMRRLRSMPPELRLDGMTFGEARETFEDLAKRQEGETRRG